MLFPSRLVLGSSQLLLVSLNPLLGLTVSRLTSTSPSPGGCYPVEFDALARDTVNVHESHHCGRVLGIVLPVVGY